MDRMKNIAVVFLVWVLASACAGSMNKSKTKMSGGKIDSYSEDLSVFRPKFDKPAEAAPEEKKSGGVIPSAEKAPLSNNAEVEAVMKRVAEKNKALTEAQGYRIQLWAGNNRSDFESAKGYILQFFPELEVYESYSQPTYRIKTGDFVSRLEAEKYLSSLKPRFGSARIIGDKINLKRSIDSK